MADMHKFQLLINPHYNIEPDAAADVYKMADEAVTTISLGLGSVGDLMYFASENPDYDPESMRADMFNIGLLMRCICNFQAAIDTTKENAECAIRKAEQGGAR